MDRLLGGQGIENYGEAGRKQFALLIEQGQAKDCVANTIPIGSGNSALVSKVSQG